MNITHCYFTESLCYRETVFSVTISEPSWPVQVWGIQKWPRGDLCFLFVHSICFLLFPPFIQLWNPSLWIPHPPCLSFHFFSVVFKLVTRFVICWSCLFFFSPLLDLTFKISVSCSYLFSPDSCSLSFLRLFTFQSTLLLMDSMPKSSSSLKEVFITLCLLKLSLVGFCCEKTLQV